MSKPWWQRSFASMFLISLLGSIAVLVELVPDVGGDWGPFFAALRIEVAAILLAIVEWIRRQMKDPSVQQRDVYALLRRQQERIDALGRESRRNGDDQPPLPRPYRRSHPHKN